MTRGNCTRKLKFTFKTIPVHASNTTHLIWPYLGATNGLILLKVDTDQ